MSTLEWTHVDMEFVSGSGESREELFLIDGLLSTSATVVSGRSESGKTNLTSHLVHALLTEQPFLDRTVRGGPHRVFWLGGDPDWARELDNSIAQGVKNWLRMDDKSPLLLSLKSNDPAVLHSTWTDFGLHLVEQNISLLVVDSLTAFAGQHGTDKIQEVQPFLNLLTHITSLGIAVLLIVHSSKGGARLGGAGKPGGSEAITAWRRVGIEVHGDGTMTANRKVTVMGNRVPQTEFVFSTLSATEYKVKSAKDKMSRTAMAEEAPVDSRSPRNRSLDLMQIRARALLDAAEESRLNATTAGAWLAANDPVERITSPDSGRKKIPQMVNAEVLIQEPSGRLVAGPRLLADTASV